ncbi:unnamed protein product [Notodromas monacha]|uniref:Uncharacterized protein n=1 Tax=Notodromas monacha TaxID=399045 RepID=A0A7R9BSH4_9CRUS|nr:unnamed protein product [Notodromas monacha]CAG0920900.1 unnamed protein product [Notodromas monacha]
MKLFVAVSFLLATASAAPVQRTLTESLDELLALVNFEGYKALIADQLANDADMQRLAAVLSAPDFVDMVAGVLQNPDYQAFIEFNDNKGVDIISYIQFVIDALGWPQKQTTGAIGSRTYADLFATWQVFFEPVGADALSWLLTAIQENVDVQDLLIYIQGQSFQDLVQYIRTQGPVVNLVADLEAEGLDVTGTFALIIEFLGWDLPPY